MESKFKPGIRVKGKPNSEDEGKTGTITEKKLKTEDELEIIE